MCTQCTEDEQGSTVSKQHNLRDSQGTVFSFHASVFRQRLLISRVIFATSNGMHVWWFLHWQCMPSLPCLCVSPAHGGLFAWATPCTSRSHGGQFAPLTPPPPPTAHPLGGGGEMGVAPRSHSSPESIRCIPQWPPWRVRPRVTPIAPPPPPWGRRWVWREILLSFGWGGGG